MSLPGLIGINTQSIPSQSISAMKYKIYPERGGNLIVGQEGGIESNLNKESFNNRVGKEKLKLFRKGSEVVVKNLVEERSISRNEG